MVIGIVAIVFPAIFGNMIIGSVAFFIAIPAIVAMIVFFLAKMYRFFFIAMVFFLVSMKLLEEPCSLLWYVGWAFIFASIVSFLSSRQKPRGLIASSAMTVFGIFAVLNCRAALNTSITILGTIMFFLGIYLYLAQKVPIMNEPDVFSSPRKHSKKINIEPGDRRKYRDAKDFEEAEFEEIE